LEDTAEFEVLSAQEIYVGNVDSDDYETAEFNIYLTNDGFKEEKVISLPLKVEYRDANNNLYTDEYDFKLKILNPKKLGIKKRSGTTTFVMFLVILGLVAFLYFRRRRKKK
jgi:LPXTG-motif cell wall-anchored protein